MGVQGLWELLAPVGRRVSVEALANKTVAVGACPGGYALPLLRLTVYSQVQQMMEPAEVAREPFQAGFR